MMTLLARARVHKHEHRTRRHAQNAVHGSGIVGAVNRWLAVRITSAVGTMWAAYCFAALALVSLPAAIASRNPVTIVQWVSTVFLQLVLLAVILVGQRVAQESADQRAESDHETLQLLHELNVTQLAILERLDGKAP